MDELKEYLKDWRIYVPFYISIVRWGLFFLLRVIPSIFYRQYKYLNVENLPDNSLKKLTPNDVTVVVTAFQVEDSFKNTIISIRSKKPKEIIIAADITCFNDSNFRTSLEKLTNDTTNVKVIQIDKPGKRVALVEGIKITKTKLVALADDDVIWHGDDFLKKLTAPFQHSDKIAGVGCKQVARINSFCDISNILADMRLAVRFLELMATTRLDKGCSCISGRTGCYRTNIIQNEEFYKYFLEEKFFGMQLQSGDDKCLTRFIMNKGYDTYHQLRSTCELSTTFKKGNGFIKQLLRWSRNTWRSDIKAVFVEGKIWKYHPITAFIMVDKMLTPFFLLFGLCYVIPIIILRESYYAFIAWAIWLFGTRCLKLCYYLYDNPEYIVYIPVFVLFQYFQSVIKIIALFTLYERGWGTRDIEIVGNEIVRKKDMNNKDDHIVEVNDSITAN